MNSQDHTDMQKQAGAGQFIMNYLLKPAGNYIKREAIKAKDIYDPVAMSKARIIADTTKKELETARKTLIDSGTFTHPQSSIPFTITGDSARKAFAKYEVDALKKIKVPASIERTRWTLPLGTGVAGTTAWYTPSILGMLKPTTKDKPVDTPAAWTASNTAAAAAAVALAGGAGYLAYKAFNTDDTEEDTVPRSRKTKDKTAPESTPDLDNKTAAAKTAPTDTKEQETGIVKMLKDFYAKYPKTINLTATAGLVGAAGFGGYKAAEYLNKAKATKNTEDKDDDMNKEAGMWSAGAKGAGNAGKAIWNFLKARGGDMTGKNVAEAKKGVAAAEFKNTLVAAPQEVEAAKKALSTAARNQLLTGVGVVGGAGAAGMAYDASRNTPPPAPIPVPEPTTVERIKQWITDNPKTSMGIGAGLGVGAGLGAAYLMSGKDEDDDKKKTEKEASDRRYTAFMHGYMHKSAKESARKESARDLLAKDKQREQNIKDGIKKNEDARANAEKAKQDQIDFNKQVEQDRKLPKIESGKDPDYDRMERINRKNKLEAEQKVNNKVNAQHVRNIMQGKTGMGIFTPDPLPKSFAPALKTSPYAGLYSQANADAIAKQKADAAAARETAARYAGYKNNMVNMLNKGKDYAQKGVNLFNEGYDKEQKRLAEEAAAAKPKSFMDDVQGYAQKGWDWYKGITPGWSDAARGAVAGGAAIGIPALIAYMLRSRSRRRRPAYDDED